MRMKMKKEGAETTKERVRRQLENYGIWKLLNYIDTSGNSTNRLLTILPYETISTILRVYRVIEYFMTMIESYNNLPRKSQFPTKNLKKIKQILEKHQILRISKDGKMIVSKGWLEKEDIDDIMDYIYEKIKQSPKGMRTLVAKGKELIKKIEKQTKPTNLALNIVIYLLAEHLKAKTGKPNWILICNFLIEQKIINPDDVSFTKETIRDRYRHISYCKIENQYENVRELYLYPEKNIKRRSVLFDDYWDRIYERDITIPPLPELLP